MSAHAPYTCSPTYWHLSCQIHSCDKHNYYNLPKFQEAVVVITIISTISLTTVSTSAIPNTGITTIQQSTYDNDQRVLSDNHHADADDSIMVIVSDGHNNSNV